MAGFLDPSLQPNPDRVPVPARRRWLRPVLLAAALFALSALAWPRPERRLVTPPGGFVLDGSGQPVALEPLFAAATLVHFWASWCPPCVTEMPELLAFAHESSHPQLLVLLVAVGDEPRAARRFLGSDRQPLYFDPSWELARRFGTSQLPETHLVVGGKIVRSFVGATRWGDPAVRAELQKWTATPASAAP